MRKPTWCRCPPSAWRRCTGSIGVLGEWLALGRALGLDDATAFEVLAATPLGAQADRQRPSLESGDYPPPFQLSLARRDADLRSWTPPATPASTCAWPKPPIRYSQMPSKRAAATTTTAVLDRIVDD